MRSSKMSLKLVKFNFYFSDWLYASLAKLHSKTHVVTMLWLDSDWWWLDSDWVVTFLSPTSDYTPIAFGERVTFCFNAPSHCLVRVRLLQCMCVWLRNGYTHAYTQIMQHTHTHKAVTGRVEAKKLLSRRRQSNYSGRRLQNHISVPHWFLLSDCVYCILSVFPCGDCAVVY